MEQKTFWMLVDREAYNKNKVEDYDDERIFSTKEEAVRVMYDDDYLLEVEVKKIYEKGGLKEVKI